MAYVYGHYKADTGELFYIGKGSGRRAWSKHSRNPHWHNVVNKHGYTVSIIEDGLADDVAYNREIELINEYGLENLVNIAEGGLGQTSAAAKEIMNRPEVKEKISAASKKQWQDPEHRERFRQKMKSMVYSSEWRAKQSEYSLNRFKDDPEAREAWTQSCKAAAQKRANNPDWLEKIRIRNQQQAKSPEYRKKVSEGLKRSWAERKLNKGKSINE